MAGMGQFIQPTQTGLFGGDQDHNVDQTERPCQCTNSEDDKDKPRESESWQSWSLTDTKSEVAPGQYTG